MYIDKQITRPTSSNFLTQICISNLTFPSKVRFGFNMRPSNSAVLHTRLLYEPFAPKGQDSYFGKLPPSVESKAPAEMSRELMSFRGCPCFHFIEVAFAICYSYLAMPPVYLFWITFFIYGYSTNNNL